VKAATTYSKTRRRARFRARAILPVVLVVLVPVIVPSLASTGCVQNPEADSDAGEAGQQGTGPGTQAGTDVQGPAGGKPEIDMETLTGFDLEVVERGEVFTHRDKPELARYVADLVLKGCAPLQGPPDLEECLVSNYVLTIHAEPGPVRLRIVNRHYPPEARAHFLQDGDRWYRLEADVLTTIYEIATTPEASMKVNAQHQEFLGRYGWHVWYRLNSYVYRLPSSFLYRAGDFPTALFWAHRSELSSRVGLDLASHAGEEVVITIYRLDRDIPELSPPGGLPRAVIVTAHDQIVGAWLDKGRHAGDAMTLAGEKVTPNEEFLSQFMDTSYPLEIELGKMEPEDIIRTYWAAIDSGDYARAHACETKTALFRYLFRNMDNSRHANESFVDIFSLENYISVEVTSIEPYSLPGEDGRENTRFYRVLVNQDLKVEMTSNDGPMTWFMSLVETPTGWRIEGRGTGP